MRILLSLILIFNYLQSAQAEDFFLHPTQQQVAQDILKRFKSTNAQLLLLGEASHEQVEYVHFFNSMCDDTFQFIAIEITADKQPLINAFMNDEIDDLNIAGRDPILKEEFLKFFRHIRQLNKRTEATGLPPIAILAIEKPIVPGETPQQWFQARDPFMFEQIRARIEAGQKGLLYLGSGHLTRYPLQSPKILRKVYGMPKFMENLGAKLERAFPDRILRVWMDSEVAPALAFSDMPPDMAFLMKIDPALRSAMMLGREKVFAIATNDAEFLKAEKKARSRGSIQLWLSKEFDYYVSLARDVKKRPTICEAILSKSGRSILLKGLMMRLL